ncbi:unnamed protein product [Paramecium octaurelia]|uniref:Uncharacterized protein n=1 Tax=Paramecium octaurelia TaxID=43137 RepID=A0A8S1S2P0_PAROT|nr:unnamed protein product [Paramecium octaurelia]
MNKQLDFIPKFPEHNPFKFQYYSEVKNGFYLENPNEVYILDKVDGWADFNGCYYQKDGNPAGWVFVSEGKYTKYDMNKRIMETGRNIYYPETIFQHGMQSERNRQFKDQNPYQKNSYQDFKNPSTHQKQDDQSQVNKFNQPSSTLKEHQQVFQRFVQENNMQLHQIFFQKRNYQTGHQEDQYTSRQRVKSENFRRSNYQENKNEGRIYNKKSKNNHAYNESYSNFGQNGRQNYHQHHSNGNFNNPDPRIRLNQSTKSNYNRYQETNQNNFSNNNHNAKRILNRSNEDNRSRAQQFQSQKSNNLIKNPFIEQSSQQQNFQNQKSIYQDKRNDRYQIDYNIESDRMQKQQSAHDYKNKNNNGDSNYSNYQNKNHNTNKDNYNYRQNNNRFQNETMRTNNQPNLQKRDFQHKKQQSQQFLHNGNSYFKQETNQQDEEEIYYFGQRDKEIPEKNGVPERRERKSRLNQP